MADLPSDSAWKNADPKNCGLATYTFLLTDIEKSSIAWLSNAQRMNEVLAEHDALIERAVTENGGGTFKRAGDAFFAKFQRPFEAVRAAIDAQRAIQARNWSGVGGLKVRMAVHVGSAAEREGDYFGPAVNRSARLLNLAHGGQILASSSAAELLASERLEDFALQALGKQPLDDPLQAVSVFQVGAAGLETSFPPLRALEDLCTNLPRWLPTLVGRSDDLERIHQVLLSHRLVTLTGPGGVGKTRLAIAAALGALQQMRDGAWIAELSSLSDGATVATTVATALQVGLTAGNPALKTLCGRLRHQELLLVLDNCEHLSAAAADFCQALLAACPNVRILATSREPLGVGDEHVIRLFSLAIPEGEINLEAACEFGAVRLFLDRARAAGAVLPLTSDTIRDVIAVCRSVDGLPLAIEMAAARAPTLGMKVLVEGLSTPLQFLTKGMRTAAARQRTMEATLDWSYGLLSLHEQTVFRRLGAFAGGFTLEGASSVASDRALGKEFVPAILASLTDKSLLTLVGERYRLLETTRAYAVSKLADASEEPATQKRHALYYQSFFSRCTDDWTLLSDTAFHNRYSPEIDNLRLATDWAFESGQETELGLSLIGNSGYLWLALSFYEESDRRLDRATAQLTSSTPARVAAAVWQALGRNSVGRSRTKRTTGAQQALKLYRELGDDVGFVLAALLNLNIWSLAGEQELGPTLLEELEPRIRRLDRQRLWGLYLVTAGVNAMLENRCAEAVQLTERALVHTRRACADDMTVWALQNLAMQLLLAGDEERAFSAMQEACVAARSSRFVRAITKVKVLCYQVTFLARRGRQTEAATTVREALSLSRDSGMFEEHLEVFASRLAHAGRARDAALLASYSDAVRARLVAPRWGYVLFLHNETMSMLQSTMAPSDLVVAYAEGARLSDQSAADTAIL